MVHRSRLWTILAQLTRERASLEEARLSGFTAESESGRWIFSGVGDDWGDVMACVAHRYLHVEDVTVHGILEILNFIFGFWKVGLFDDLEVRSQGCFSF